MSAKISLIAAIGRNRELGGGNDLPWHLPDDFAWFVNHTRGHPIIMGRKTMDSLGPALKNRRNLVVSRSHDLQKEGFEMFSTLETAINSARTTENDEIFIIGGGDIFMQAMDQADKIYMTRVDGDFPEADVFFPEWDAGWKRTFHETHSKDERHAYAFVFEIWERADV